MTGFCIQEFIISGIYIWKTLDILKTGERKRAHRIMWQLFTINVIIICLDIALLAIEYRDLKIAEMSVKALVYSVKLKLEFAILSKLVEFSTLRNRTLTNTFVEEADHGAGRQDSTSTARRPSSSGRLWHRPQWMEDLEKSRGQHFDGDRSGQTNSTIGRQSPGSIGGDSSVPLTQITESRFRDQKKHSELMYADAMRVVSQ